PIIVAAGVYLRMSAAELARRTTPVADGSDGFYSGPDLFYSNQDYGPVVRDVVKDLKKQTTRKETLVCMPEGLLINYLARRANPCRHLNFNPVSLEMFGEERILRDFAARAPDYIIVANVDYGRA